MTMPSMFKDLLRYSKDFIKFPFVGKKLVIRILSSKF